MFDLKNALKMLPDLPGIYLMHDKDDKVIYVGKAKNLKNRVRSYFVKNQGHSVKVTRMVSHVAYFEYIVTNTELEALMLECTLIKQHMPFYNILLKDDKAYPYIKVTMDEEYPRIFAARRKENDKSRYFGPFSGMSVVKDMLDIVKNIFRIPDCKLKFPKDVGRVRPCINKQIDTCFAPCTGEISKEEYREIFEKVCEFLGGDHAELITSMTEKMKEYSENLEFEKAARERDKILSVKRFKAKQIVVGEKNVNRDIISFDCYANKAFFAVVFVRGGKVTAHRSLEASGYADLSDSEIACEFIKSFYTENEDIPEQIIIKAMPDEAELLSRWLSEMHKRKVQISEPKRGERRELLTIATTNVTQAINRYKNESDRDNHRNFRLNELKEKLVLDKIPERIESYDISNTGESDRVGVMAVFENGEYKGVKSRFFKIKYVTGQDDYACMSEVIERRINRACEEEKNGGNAFLPLPDLILLDGGATHVNVIKRLLDSMNANVEVWGMVKDDNHTFKGFTDGERLFEPSKNSEIYKFGYMISERVHKSAIEYHRKQRTKTGLKSELDNIAGIGEKRKKLLLINFKSIENIRNASLEELINAGLDKRSSENVFKYFN